MHLLLVAVVIAAVAGWLPVTSALLSESHLGSEATLLHDFAVSSHLHDFMAAQCIVTLYDQKICEPDSLYGTYSITRADILHLAMSRTLRVSELVAAIAREEAKSNGALPRVVKIAIQETDHASFNESAVGRDIDFFLTQRPWWGIAHEGKKRLEPGVSIGSNVITGDSNGSGSVGSNSNEYLIILERYPVEWRAFLENVVRSQYLTASNCEKTPMIVGRMSAAHPGVMTTTAYFTMDKMKLRYSVFSYYFPGSSVFSDDNTCLNHHNKIDCAFLSMTNCSMSDEIVACKDHICLQQYTKDLYGAILVDSASTKGHIVTEMKEGVNYGSLPLEHSVLVPESTPQFKYIRAVDRTVGIVDNDVSRNSLFIFLFIMRPTYLFRARMNKLIQSMRNPVGQEPFLPAEPCVAVHLRRGDRTGLHVDMIEWCANATYDMDPKNSNNKKGCVDLEDHTRFGSCFGAYGDLGCGSIPFGAIELKHVVTKVPRLLNETVRDLVVFTDDPIWLSDQVASLHKTEPWWRIRSFETPNISAVVDLNRIHESDSEYRKALHFLRSGGSASGVLFEESMKAVQQCSAFIGHRGSGVTKMFYSSMCIHHTGRYGVCPPIYDFAAGSL